MGRKVISVWILLCLCLGWGQAFAQEETKKKEVPSFLDLLEPKGKSSDPDFSGKRTFLKGLTTEIGFSLQGSDWGLSAPFAIPSDLLGPRYSTHGQFLYSWKPGRAIGLELMSAPRTFRLSDDTYGERRCDFYGLTFVRAFALPNPRWFFRTSLSWGYVYTKYELQHASDWSQRRSVRTSGFGLSHRVTIGCKVTRGISLGLQFNTFGATLGRWRGDESLVTVPYRGSFLFGRNTNWFMAPSVGLVWTSSLGR